jgi:hypothetical protein
LAKISTRFAGVFTSPSFRRKGKQKILKFQAVGSDQERRLKAAAEEGKKLGLRPKAASDVLLRRKAVADRWS